MRSELLAALKSTLRALETHLDDECRDLDGIHRDTLCPCNENEVAQARAVIAEAEKVIA